MLVDIQMARAQTAYKREQLAKSFKSDRRERRNRHGSTRGPGSILRIRKPAAA